MVRIWCFHCHSPGFNPWLGNWNPIRCLARKKESEKNSLFWKEILYPIIYERSVFSNILKYVTFKIKECSSLLCPISYSIQKDIDVPALKNHNEYLNFILHLSIYSVGFPCGSEGEDSACNAGDLSLIPGSGRSSGEANGSPLQYSCLENPMDEEPGGLQSTGSQRICHMWVTHFHFSLFSVLIPNWVCHLKMCHKIHFLMQLK